MRTNVIIPSSASLETHRRGHPSRVHFKVGPARKVDMRDPEEVNDFLGILSMGLATLICGALVGLVVVVVMIGKAFEFVAMIALFLFLLGAAFPWIVGRLTKADDARRS